MMCMALMGSTNWKRLVPILVAASIGMSVRRAKANVELEEFVAEVLVVMVTFQHGDDSLDNAQMSMSDDEYDDAHDFDVAMTSWH